MIRRLGLLTVVLCLAVPPLAQDLNTVRGERAAGHRYQETPPKNTVLDASNHPTDWEHSTLEQRARHQAQVELARQQLRKLHEETTQLVALANELKSELDKTAAQKLSVDAVKKTEQIEKLAKNIRNRMKTL